MLKHAFLLSFLFGFAFSTIEVNVTAPFNTNLTLCTEIANDGTSSLLYFVQQPGIIQFMDVSNFTMTPISFFDIRDRVVFSADSGLLGLAFHPNYKTNGYFFVLYSSDLTVLTLSRFTAFNASSNSPFLTANTSAEVVLFKTTLNSNNTGGKLAFNRGLLYISIGVDGDLVTKLGLNRLNFNGKILRIDVNTIDSQGNYSIPSDNPFVNDTSYLPEIWALGFRNPWKFSFDCATNLMYLGDVGISAEEEIDLVKSGLNYGYPTLEGNLCVNSSSCDRTGLTSPIFTYNHTAGNSAIIGGYVYRGSLLPQLFGRFVFGDFTSGNMWALDIDGAQNGIYSARQLVTPLYPTLSTFGVDIFGNLYFAQYADGSIHRIGDSSNGIQNCIVGITNTASASNTQSGSNGLTTVVTTVVRSSGSTQGGSSSSGGNHLAVISVFSLFAMLFI